MTEFIAQLEQAIDARVQRWQERTNRYPAGRFPTWAKQTAPLKGSSQLLSEAVQAWLGDPDGPAIAVLQGRLGWGKTEASMAVYESIRMTPSATTPLARDAEGVRRRCLWIPCRDGRYFDKDPDREILENLQVRAAGDLWHPSTNIACVVLDGFDEFLCRAGREKVLDWFDALLGRMVERAAPPRILLVARDAVIDRKVIDRPLMDMLDKYGEQLRTRPDTQQATPIWWEIEPLDPGDWQRILLELLSTTSAPDEQTQRSPELVHRLMAAVRGVGITSPLEFQITYELLSRYKASAPPDAPFANRWVVVDRWISQAIQHASRVHVAPRGQPGHMRDDLRRVVAEGICLVLVLSGRGMEGATLEELARCELLQHLWKPFAQIADPSGSGLGESDLVDIANSVRLGTLLSVRGGRYAPFHQAVLVHLAASALARLAGPAVAPPSPPGSPGPMLHHAKDRPDGQIAAIEQAESLMHIAAPLREAAMQMLLNAPVADSPSIQSHAGRSSDKLNTPTTEAPLPLARIWEQTARETGVPGIVHIGSVINELVEPAALHAGSAFEETLQYWSKHHLAAMVTRRGAGALDRIHELLLGDFERATQMGAAVVFRNVAIKPLRDSAAPPPPLASMSELRGALTSGGRDITFGDFVEVPAGAYFGWTLDAEGNRVLTRITLPGARLLAAQLCDVRTYARFLADHAEVPLPDMPEVDWQRLGHQVIYAPDHGDQPVAGVSQAEARLFCAWLTDRVDPALTGDWRIRFDLPAADCLRVAAWGEGLPSGLEDDGSGPFGHQDLTGRLGQWTQDEDGAECLVFGGNASMGSPDGSTAQKALERQFPDLCYRYPPQGRNRLIGFRICIEASPRDRPREGSQEGPQP